MKRDSSRKGAKAQSDDVLPVTPENGWKFPFQGDEWPDKEDWYWVAAPKPGRRIDSSLFVPKRRFWDSKAYRFRGVPEELVVAYRA